jgi:hypothetical protein
VERCEAACARLHCAGARYDVGCSCRTEHARSWRARSLRSQTTSPHPGTTSRRRERDLTTQRIPLSTRESANCARDHEHGYALHPQTPQWSTRSSSGAASVMPSTSSHTARALANGSVTLQASRPDYGSSALKCARSSTRNRSGSTPSSPELVAALATGLRASSNANSDSLPTDETNCLKSAHGGRSAKRPLVQLKASTSGSAERGPGRN